MTLKAPLLQLALFLVALSGSVSLAAQSSPATDSKHFQMALFTYDYHTGVNASYTVGYVDIPMFGSDIPSLQPSGRSIMRLESWADADPLEGLTVDWSRILAVVIDEPYIDRLQQEYNDYSDVNPCFPGPGAESSVRRPRLSAIRTRLLNAANLVHSVAPQTRVWVNFHERAVRWMRGNNCEHLNDPTFDVVSLDHYEVNFSTIEDEHAWFISTFPQQQLALVPGTHYRVGGDSPAQAAARLQAYFDYANSMNENCDMGLGRVGRTGSFDGCRVWIVAGWSAEPAYPSNAPEYYGILHSSSGAIATAWLNQYSKIRRPGRNSLFADELGVLLSLLE